MSVFRQKVGREDPGDIDVVDYLCWQGGALIMMVVMGLLAIRMTAVSLWLTVQWGSNPIVITVASVVGVCLWFGLAFLAWNWATGRALVNIFEGRGSGILFLILPALAAVPPQALWLLSWWWGRDVVASDPLTIYCTTLAVLLLVLPPTGIHWRKEGRRRPHDRSQESAQAGDAVAPGPGYSGGEGAGRRPG